MSPTEDAELVPVLENGIPLGVPLIIATGLQSLLRGHGIEATISGFRSEPVLPFRLLVSSDDAEEAGRVIAEALAGGAAAADEAEREGEATGDRPPEDAGSSGPGLF
jgi:hypothetical protein